MRIKRCINSKNWYQDEDEDLEVELSQKFISKSVLNCCDTSFEEKQFVTGGRVVQLWDFNRRSAINSFDWCDDTLTNGR